MTSPGPVARSALARRLATRAPWGPCLTLLVACGDGGGAPSGTAGSAAPSAASAPTAPSSAPPGSAAAAPGSAAAAPVAAPRPPAPRCKAATSGKKTEHLATRRELATHLVLEHGALFVATFGQTRGELVSVPVDGGAPVVLAPLDARATGLAVNATDVYFTKGDALFRVPRGGGEPARISEGFGSGVSLDGTHAWGLSFDAASKLDRVVRAPLAGGAPEVLHERKREDTKETFNLSGFAAVRSTGREVLVADAGKRVVLGIDPTTREAKVLAEDVAYPTGIGFFPIPPPAGGEGPSRMRPSKDGSFFVYSEAGGGLSMDVNEHGTFAADSGYMSPIANVYVTRPGSTKPTEVARISSNLSKVTGDADCVYVANTEALQTVLMALPIPPAAGEAR